MPISFFDSYTVPCIPKSQNTRLSPNKIASREFRDLPCEFSRGRQEAGVGLLDHDVVFWLGDLNYRVSEVVNLDEVFQRCGTKEGREFLQAHDQLNVEV